MYLVSYVNEMTGDEFEVKANEAGTYDVVNLTTGEVAGTRRTLGLANTLLRAQLAMTQRSFDRTVTRWI